MSNVRKAVGIAAGVVIALLVVGAVALGLWLLLRHGGA
jgi:tetrahydromethanopterin S-methyltransferase subunit F